MLIALDSVCIGVILFERVSDVIEFANVVDDVIVAPEYPITLRNNFFVSVIIPDNAFSIGPVGMSSLDDKNIVLAIFTAIVTRVASDVVNCRVLLMR
jgi:hypothetical protein